jgi:predicted nuclease of predicted toxin-antitoxin system
LNDDGIALVWIRKGNCSNRALMNWLEPLWPDVLRRLEQGEQLIELRA